LAILPNYYFSVFRKSMKILNSIIKPWQNRLMIFKESDKY
jgi:hypothetical protein